MRILLLTAMAVFLCSCSSGESVEPVKSSLDKAPDTGQLPDVQSMEFVPPNDGKLSDEHMKMYISVKIKEKMLEQVKEQEKDIVTKVLESSPIKAERAKQASAATGSANVEKTENLAGETVPASENEVADSQLQTKTETVENSETEMSTEQMAVKEFGYDAKLYQWIKQTVADAMVRNSIDSMALQLVKDKQMAREEAAAESKEPAVVIEINGHNDAIVARYAQELAFAHSDDLTDGDPKSASQAENVAKQPAEPTVTQPTGS